MSKPGARGPVVPTVRLVKPSPPLARKSFVVIGNVAAGSIIAAHDSVGGSA
jgi:hypothetical protein